MTDRAQDPSARIAELEDLVERLESRLRAAQDRVDEARKARDAFLSDMGHEFRTPLNAVIGFCGLLAPEASALQRGYVDSIRTAGLRLLELLNESAAEAQAPTGPIDGSSTCLVPRSAPGSAEEDDEALQRVRYRPGKVLVVDDIELNRMLVRGLLERMGLRVSEAIDGESAVQAALADPPDLVLMDMRMPGMGGAHAASLLRLDPRTASVPLLALTASVDLPPEPDAGSPFDGHLTKPIRPARMVGALDRYLRRDDPSPEAPVAESVIGLEPEGRDLLLAPVRAAVEEMGGAIRFSRIRSLVVEAELLAAKGPLAAQIAGWARGLHLAADAHDVPAIERLLATVLGEIP